MGEGFADWLLKYAFYQTDWIGDYCRTIFDYSGAPEPDESYDSINKYILSNAPTKGAARQMSEMLYKLLKEFDKNHINYRIKSRRANSQNYGALDRNLANSKPARVGSEGV